MYYSTLSLQSPHMQSEHTHNHVYRHHTTRERIHARTTTPTTHKDAHTHACNHNNTKEHFVVDIEAKQIGDNNVIECKGNDH